MGILDVPGYQRGWFLTFSTSATLTSGATLTFTVVSETAINNVVGRFFHSRSVSGPGSAQAVVSASLAGYFYPGSSAQSFMFSSQAITSSAAAIATNTFNVNNVIGQYPLVMANFIAGTNSSCAITYGFAFQGTQ